MGGASAPDALPDAAIERLEIANREMRECETAGRRRQQAGIAGRSSTIDGACRVTHRTRKIAEANAHMGGQRSDADGVTVCRHQTFGAAKHLPGLVVPARRHDPAPRISGRS